MTETELRERLAGAASTVRIDEPPIEESLSHGQRRRRLRRLGAGATAVVLVAGTAWSLLALRGLGERQTIGSPPAPSGPLPSGSPTSGDGEVGTVEGFEDQPFGHPWTDLEGNELPEGRPGQALVIHTLQGPSHCGWEKTTWLNVAWPLGSQATKSSGSRQYIRDPNGDLDPELARLLDTDAELPADAVDSGFRRNGWALWTASDADSFVYLVSPERVERWPRNPDPMACA